MVFQDGYEVITPEENCLVDNGKSEEIKCPIESCGKIVSNVSEVHLPVSCHGQKTLKSANPKSKFACPAKGCPRNVEAVRQQFFPDLYSLKMHYRSVHGEKKFKCAECSKMFGNHVVFTQHKSKCKKFYYCECGISYTSKNALFTHAKRKQHNFVGQDSVNKMSKSSKEQNATSTAGPVSGVLYLPNNQCQMNLKSNLDVMTNVTSPRVIRILPGSIKKEKCVILPQDSILQLQNIAQEKNHVELSPAVSREVKDVRSTKPCLVIENYPSKDSNSSTIAFTTVSTNIHDKRKHSSKFYCDEISHIKPERNTLKSPVETVSISLGPSIASEELRPKVSEVEKQSQSCRQSYFKENYLTSIDPNLLRKSGDVFDDFSISAKKLADTFTQTSLSLHNLKDSCSLKKVSMDTQTQVNICNFESPKKSTMDTHTQIDFYTLNDRNEKSTTDSHTQIDSFIFNKIPKMSSMDTQTLINSSNFNDAIKKLTMDTQTELNSYYFNDTPKRSTVEAQTQMNSFTEYTTEVLESSDSSVQCHMPTYTMEKNFSDNLFPVIDNETQTDTIDSWLNNFVCQDFSNMETQTSLQPDDFNVEPLALDKSVQIEDMIGLDDSCMIPTESSNMSTQTMGIFEDPWLSEDLVCESSATQTDYFENLDFTDIDFHLDQKNNISSNPNQYCNDVMISGNNIETQTTIPLYELLDSSLISNYFNVDKHMTNIQTQTNAFPGIFENQRNHIETQTDDI